MAEGKKHLGLVIVGHVDAGKSTTTGRLLFELGGISARDLEKLKEIAEKEGKGSFYFAYFMDNNKEERQRGVTISCTTKEFFTDNYHYTIIDAPGHRDFIKNMVSGSSQADVALVMVPADKNFESAIQAGNAKKAQVKGQTRHHIELTRLLGITQSIVGVNKMDNTSKGAYSKERFDEIQSEMKDILSKCGYDKKKEVPNIPIIPISGWVGDNITKKSEKMDWWKGTKVTNKDGKEIEIFTLVDALNNFVCPPTRALEAPLRMPVSGIYQIKGKGDVVTGRVEQGTLKPKYLEKGREKPTAVTFWPMGVDAFVNTIEMHHKSVPMASHGDNVGVQIKGFDRAAKKIARVGDVMVLTSDETIGKVEEFEASLIVQDHPGKLKAANKDGQGGYTPLVTCRTAKCACRMIAIPYAFKTNDYKKANKAAKKAGKKASKSDYEQQPAPFVQKGDQAKITFKPEQPFCLDSFKSCPGLGRIALLESNNLVMLGKVNSVKYSFNKM